MCSGAMEPQLLQQSASTGGGVNHRIYTAVVHSTHVYERWTLDSNTSSFLLYIFPVRNTKLLTGTRLERKQCTLIWVRITKNRHKDEEG